MQNDLDRVLDQCLDRVLQRHESVEACLADYPQHADQLRPLLDAALEAQQALSFVPDPNRKRTARLQFLNTVDAQTQHASRPLLRRLLGWQPRWAVATAAVLVLLIAGGASTVAASTDSVPGHPLYPIKRATENMRLVFTFGSDNKAELHARLADRRAEEMAEVAHQGRDRFIIVLTQNLEHHLQKVRGYSGVAPAVLVSLPSTSLTPTPEAPKPPPTAHPTPIATAVPASFATPEDPRLRRLHARMEQSLRRQEIAFAEMLDQLPPDARQALRQAMETFQREYRISLEALSQRRSELLPFILVPGHPSEVDGRLRAFSPATGLVVVETPGFAIRLRITDDTKITVNGEPAEARHLQRGDRVRVSFQPGSSRIIEMEVEQ